MSNNMYFCYRDLVTSTGIHTSQFFQLVEDSITKEYLITCSVSTVLVYEIKTSIAFKPSLHLVFKDKLHGRVQDIQVYRSIDKPSDELILSFDTGKFVFAYYNPFKRSLELSKTFNMEENAIGLGSLSKLPFRYRSQPVGIGSIPILSVDNQNGLVCSVLYDQYLNFMVISPESSVFSNNLKGRSLESNSYSQYESSDVFLIDIQYSHALHGAILDICFIDGYSKPTIAVLIESNFLPLGHADKVRHTCSVVVLTIDLINRNSSVLWQQENLPHDAVQLLKINTHSCSYDAFIGSLLLISMNAIQIVTASEVLGLAMNGFSPVSLHPSHPYFTNHELSNGYELDSSHWVCIDSTNFIGALKDGSILLLRLVLPLNNNGVQLEVSADSSHASLLANTFHLSKLKFDVSVLANSVLSSCICTSRTENLIFIGSRFNDSVLLYVNKSIETSNVLFSNSNGSVPTPYATPASKRQRRLSRTPNLPSSNSGVAASLTPRAQAETNLTFEDVENEELSLYGLTLDAVNGYSSSQGISYINSLVYFIIIHDA